jgi:hypothetical protein
MRSPLPSRRRSYSFTIEFQGERYDVTIGHYNDPAATVGEVFINRIMGPASAKVGTLLDSVCRDGAILISLALQHGAPLRTVAHAVTRNVEGEPQTIIGAIVDRLIADDAAEQIC